MEKKNSVEASGLACFDWLRQIGRNSFLRSQKPTPWHTHPGCIELIYCQHGTCEYESRGKIYRLSPGRVFVSRPNESHRMLSNPKGLATYFLLVRLPEKGASDFFLDEIRFIERKLRAVPRLFDGGARTGSHFVRLFRLANEPFADAAEGRLRLMSTFFSLLLSAIDASEMPISDGGSACILTLAEEMRTHPERTYSIENLTTRSGFSQTSLMTGFKAATGYTPHAYLMKCRIDRAKELLAANTLRVTEIATMLGFPSPQHFATQFRNATGMTPRTWTAQSCM